MGSVIVEHDKVTRETKTETVVRTDCGSIVDTRVFTHGFRKTRAAASSGRSTVYVDSASLPSANAAATSRKFHTGHPLVTNAVNALERHDFSVVAATD